MAEEKKKKKRGFLSKLGFKSKDEKLAEEAAARAAAQEKIDADMAERMAAINAAALASARQQDHAATGTALGEDEEARIAEEERARAEAQAQKDVEAAKRLAVEKRAKEAEAKRLAEEEAALAKREAERAAKAAQEKAAAKARAEQDAKEKAAAEKKRLAAEKEALEKARKEQGEAQAAALKARQEAEAAARAREAEIAAQRAEAEAKAREEADAKAREAERLAALEAAKARAAEDAAEAEAARLAQLEADKETAARLAREQAAAAERLETEGGFLARISSGLKKSTSQMADNMASAFTKRKLDDEAIEELQDLLIAADLGVGPATKVTDLLAKDRFDKQVTPMEIKIALADVISEILTPLEKPIVLSPAKPQIMLFVGVNGSGKTTTLGKMAKRYRDQGKKVMLAAGDTFRAAAVEQLTIWGERADAPVISGKLGADAAGLVFDAVQQAKDQDVDILMIDTAGRLQNRSELMDELSKVVRVIKKQIPEAPHHCILVLDATVGQNALSQTEVFRDVAGVTGLVMTKLDGTAKGGVLVALSDKFKLPIHAIGIGERIEDLENFSAPVFAAAISGVADAVLEAG
jgi:fused signal recognition particle receptor